MNQTLKFQVTTQTSPEFAILSTISTLHVTARQKNIELLKMCGAKGVAFDDIRAHLLNEAKRCGLWESGKKEKYCKTFGWYVAVVNFIIWKNKRYKNYNVPLETAKKSDKVIKKTIIRRTEQRAPREVQAAGPSSDSPLDNTLTSNGDVKKTVKSEVGGKFITPDPSKVLTVKEQANSAAMATDKQKIEDLLAAGNAITRPVEDCLTAVQIQTIVFRNLEVLGQKAIELGAGYEFNELMVTMGLVDEIIPFDEVAYRISDLVVNA